MLQRRQLFIFLNIKVFLALPSRGFTNGGCDSGYFTRYRTLPIHSQEKHPFASKYDFREISSDVKNSRENIRYDSSENILDRLKHEAFEAASQDAAIAPLLHSTVLSHASLSNMLIVLISNKIATPFVGAMEVSTVMTEMFSEDETIVDIVTADLVAHHNAEPSTDILSILLFHKGFHALMTYRFMHWLWCRDQRQLARFIQSVNSEVHAADIHPAAIIGRGAYVSPGCDIVVGETAVIGISVALGHGVTLGGTGKERGDRHPKIGDHVILGTGASVLGNIRVGERARIEPGSVVLKEILPYTINGGIPSKVLGYTEGQT